MYLMARMNLHLPALQVVSFETRAEYVDLAEIEFLRRAIREAHDDKAQIELAIGFEAFDDDVRNDQFLKGLTLGTFEDLLHKLAGTGFRLKCYFMQKPVVGMSDAAAIEDIRKGIAYLAQMSEQHQVPINLHLNPTYAARGTPLETGLAAGEWAPPKLQDVATAVLHAEGGPLSVYVGLDDEGLAVQGGGLVRPGDEEILAALQAFNRTQDYAALRRALLA